MKKLALGLVLIAGPAHAQNWIDYQQMGRQMIVLATPPLIMLNRIVVPLGIFIECHEGVTTIRIDPAEVAEFPWLEMQGDGLVSVTSIQIHDNFGEVAIFDADYIAPILPLAGDFAVTQIIETIELRQLITQHRVACGL